LSIYVAVYYFIAYITISIVFSIKDDRKRNLVVLILVAAIIGSSFFPIYVTGGYINGGPYLNIIDVMKELHLP